MSRYPKPWKVVYKQVCLEWHPKSRPCIVDARGNIVVHMQQMVDHPGMYDELADNTAQEIVRAVNAMREV